MTAAENPQLSAVERMAALKGQAEQDQADALFKGLSEQAAAYLRRVFELSPGHTLAHDPITKECVCPLPPGVPIDTAARGWLDEPCRQLEVLLLRVQADRVANAVQYKYYTPEPGFRLEILADALVLMAGGHIGSREVWSELLRKLDLAKQDDAAAACIDAALVGMHGLEASAEVRFPYGVKHPRLAATPGTVCDGKNCGGRDDADTTLMLACFTAGHRAHVATDDIYAVATEGKQIGRAVMTVDGKGTSEFGAMMVATAWEKLGRHPGPERVSRASTLISGLARKASEQAGQPKTLLPVRSTPYGEGYLIDLGTGQYVWVCADGWSVVDYADHYPVMLAAQRPLPTPVRPNPILPDPRLGHLGFTPDDRNWHQIRIWQATAFFADHERQLMMLTGGSGSGKTKRAQSIAALVDPLAEDAHGRPVLGGPLPDDETLGPELLKNYLFTSDNLSDMDAEQSDRLCRIATGYRFTRRVLYTTADTWSATVLRAGLMTGIDVPPQLKEDAQNRLLHLELDTSATKRASNELDTERRALGPVMLGALLDDMVLVLRAYRAGDYDAHDRFPIVACAARVFGPEYIESRKQRQVDLAEHRAEGDTQLSALATVVKYAGVGTGTRQIALSASELYTAAISTTRKGEPAKGWSTTPRALADRIRRNTATLAAFGITVEYGRSKAERWTVLSYDEAKQRADIPRPAPQPDGAFGTPVVGPFVGDSAQKLFAFVQSETTKRVGPAPF